MADPEPSGRVEVLLDPSDDVAVTAGLLARHRPAAGVIVVHPTAGVSGALALAHDVLHALGLPAERLRQNRLTHLATAWRAAAAWALADRIEHLVILRAHRLDRRSCFSLLQFARRSRIALLLVCHTRTIPRAMAEHLIGVRHRIVARVPPDLDMPRPVTPAPTARTFPKLPRLPRATMLHYRADIYRRHRDVFSAVDELYGYGVDAACGWLRGRVPADARGRYHADESLHEFVTGLVRDCPTSQHAVAQLRGAQAGFLLHGYWLQVPFTGRVGGPGLTSTPVTAETVTRIRAAVSHPVLAAGVALALFTGVSLTSFQSMRGGSIPTPCASTVTIPIRQYGRAPVSTSVLFSVPPAARPLLRAAHTFCLALSSDPRQGFFAGIQSVAHRIAEAATWCGITLPRTNGDVGDVWHKRVYWTKFGDPLHQLGPEHTTVPGRSCLSAAPVAAHPSAVPHRDSHVWPGRRWTSNGSLPEISALLNAYIEEDEPRLRPPPRGKPGDPPCPSEWQRRHELVHRHLAVLVPRAGGRPGDALTVHPDIPFALRLSDQPGDE